MQRGLIRVSSGGAVLCLHSLTTPELPSANIANLPLGHFFALVRAVRRVAHVVPLSELLTTHASGRPTGGAVAITFDDAYTSLLITIDRIRSERIPITVFVTTAAAETGARYWWDRVDDLFARVARTRWAEFESELGLPTEYREGQPAEFGPLRPLRQWILAQHKGRWPESLEPALAALERESDIRTAHRSMTFEELKSCSAEPMIDFGVHTLSHPVLPLLTAAEARSEIGDSFELLRRRLPRVEPILAIPFGLFDQRTARQAREAGMTSSLTLAARTLGAYSAAEALPRFGLSNREPPWKLVLRVTGLAERLFSRRMAGGGSYPALPSATT